MTDSFPCPLGLLTGDEAEILADPDPDIAEHSELRQRLRTRLTETLQDFSVLYPTLPADDLADVFTGEDCERLAPIRTGTQDVLALLMLGMLFSDDIIDTRFRDAIQNAGLSYGEDIDVTVSLRRGLLPTIEQFAAQLDEEGLTGHTFALFESFLYQPDTDLHGLETIASKLDIEVTPEERAEIESAVDTFERPR
ncbi:hypothetical protein [Salinibaculum rarum]|uniref:hypothetical protein n=1 Tax=Salinibaculum rarum TaxID=3058903 RepID=UPI00265F737B|nr:hypothetical protein [Salinibaculum sp. KK48]